MRHHVIEACARRESVIELDSPTYDNLCAQLSNMRRNGPYVGYQSTAKARNICVLTASKNFESYGFRCLIDLIRCNFSKTSPHHLNLSYAGRTVDDAIQNAMKNREVFIFDDPASLYCWIGEVGKSLSADC